MVLAVHTAGGTHNVKQPVEVRSSGVLVALRPTLDFIGLTVADDATPGAEKATVSAPFPSAIGADETFLVADSGESSGAKWAYLATVLQAAVPAVNGYLTTCQLCGVDTAAAYGSSQQSLVLYGAVFVPVAMTFDRISCTVSTLGGAGAVVRLGIYAADPTTMRPTTLILDAGTAVATSTGEKLITINQALAPGVYWLAVVPQVASATRTAVASSPGWIGQVRPDTDSPTGGSGVGITVSTSGETDALGSDPTLSIVRAGTQSWPVMGLRRSA